MHTSTTYEVPAAYGVTFLTLLVRDPRCIFAQWEVTQSDRLDAARRAAALRGGDGATSAISRQLVLRIYDVTESDHARSNGHHDAAFAHDGTILDLVVDGQQSHYITLSKSGHTFTAQIGVQIAGDPATFTAVAASNTVQTPPGRPSDVIDSTWLRSDELFRTAGALARSAGHGLQDIHWEPEFGWDTRVDAFSPGFTVKGVVPAADGTDISEVQPSEPSSGQEGSH